MVQYYRNSIIIGPTAHFSPDALILQAVFFCNKSNNFRGDVTVRWPKLYPLGSAGAGLTV